MENKPLPKWILERDQYLSLKMPYYILGSNFGPYVNSEFKRIIGDIVSGSIDTCFRDKASYLMFKHLPTARVATDIAFTLEFETERKREVHPTAVISIIDVTRKFDKKNAAKYEFEMANLAMNLVSRGFKVKLMSFCRKEGDEAASRRILNLVHPENRVYVETYNYRGELEHALSTLSEAEIVVGSRFHAVILGITFKCKVLPVAYSDKTLNVLEDIGFKGPIVDIRKIGEFNGRVFNFDDLHYHDATEQKELAQLQFQELDKVLQRR